MGRKQIRPTLEGPGLLGRIGTNRAGGIRTRGLQGISLAS